MKNILKILATNCLFVISATSVTAQASSIVDDVKFGVKRIETHALYGGMVTIYSDGTGTGPCNGTEGVFFLTIGLGTPGDSDQIFASYLAEKENIIRMALAAKTNNLKLGLSFDANDTVDPPATCGASLGDSTSFRQLSIE